MMCPHCKHEPENDDESDQFFIISNDIKMEKRRVFDNTQERTIYGCPKCLKLFMASY